MHVSVVLLWFHFVGIMKVRKTRVFMMLLRVKWSIDLTLFAGWPCKVKMMLGRQVDRTKLGSNFHFFPLRKWDIRDTDNDDDWLTDGMGKFIW